MAGKMAMQTIKINHRPAVLRNRKRLDGSPALRGRVTLEYWNFSDNVGDRLAPVITEWMLKRLGLGLAEPVAHPCHLLTLGSILGLGIFDAVVWGSGVNTFEHVGRIARQKDWRRLDIRAVRGPLTAQVLREHGYVCPQVYGDPAVLLPLLYPIVHPARKCGALRIGHYTRKAESGEEWLSVRTGDWRTFLDKLSGAEVVYSSSLHGIILAESYGIPAIFVREGMETELMKYYDWYFATGRYEVRSAAGFAEAERMTPMELPDLRGMQQALLQSFPYDLWRG